MTDEEDEMAPLRREWVEHEQTRKLLEEAHNDQRVYLGELMFAASASTDPKVTKVWAKCQSVEIRIKMLGTGRTRPDHKSKKPRSKDE